MNEKQKDELMIKLIDNLPTLRKRLNLTQVELSTMIGLSRYTIMALEKKQRNITWNTFLSLLMIFMANCETNKLLCAMEIYSNELREFLNVGRNKGNK